MTKALVVNESHDSSQALIEIINRKYSEWNMIGVDKYEDAIEKIKTESIDIMALDAHLPCKDCQELAATLHDKQPDAKIYIAMKDLQINTDYSRAMNRVLILFSA